MSVPRRAGDQSRAANCRPRWPVLARALEHRQRRRCSRKEVVTVPITPTDEDLDGRRARRLGQGDGARPHAQPALRHGRLRGHPRLRDGQRAGDLPPARPHEEALQRGPHPRRWTCPSPRTRSSRRSRLTVRENGLASCYIRPIAYLGYGEMGLNPMPCKVKRCGRRLALGRLPRRRGHRQRHPPQGQLLGAP